VPLGGLGEIGMNCLAIEQQDGILVVDCGTAFPFDDLGVDVIHPDFSWLVARAERIRGIFLTHGHEDHIGALPYLLASIDVPIWGPPHALGVARRRLAEHGFAADDLALNPAHAGKRYTVGPFEVEPVRVSHSIVEASALAIRTRAGVVLHSGDYNFDPDPPDREPTDEARLRALGDGGIELLLSDSTNVDVPERAGSEREVARALEQIVGEAEGRVFIGLFASNVQRLISIGEIAQRRGRKLCLLGRSLLTQREVATEIGRLGWPSNLCIAAEQARSYPRDELIVLAGGTQAEPASALMRLASDSHRDLAIEPGDTVVLSSRAIPGNERAVAVMTNDILRRGAKLHTRLSDPRVHTSGHASQAEQRHMIELVRPRSFVPLHGTLHHLLRHAELARDHGVKDVLAVENGTALSFDTRGLRDGGAVPIGRVPIGHRGEPLSPDVLRRRAELGRGGVVAVSVMLDRGGRVLAGPSVSSRGVPAVDDEAASLRALERSAAEVVEWWRRNRDLDLTQEIRRALRRSVLELSGARPSIEVQLLGLD
jgi:ribonuclease J